MMKRGAFVGTAKSVGDRLRALASELGIDEVVVLTWTYDLAPRRHSYALLAQEFGLGG